MFNIYALLVVLIPDRICAVVAESWCDVDCRAEHFHKSFANNMFAIGKRYYSNAYSHALRRMFHCLVASFKAHIFQIKM